MPSPETMVMTRICNIDPCVCDVCDLGLSHLDGNGTRRWTGGCPLATGIESVVGSFWTAGEEVWPKKMRLPD